MTDEAPELAHELARKWLEDVSRDIIENHGQDLAFHSISIFIVSLVAHWMRSQPTAERGYVLMRHIARLIVEGFDAGSQLFNGDHQGNGQYIEPPPRVEVVELPRRTILPRRRPPRSRPC